MKTDEGLKLQVMQVVSFQIKNRQTIERSQSVRVYLGDVVVTQLQHLNRHTGTNFVHRELFSKSWEKTFTCLIYILLIITIILFTQDRMNYHCFIPECILTVPKDWFNALIIFLYPSILYITGLSLWDLEGCLCLTPAVSGHRFLKIWSWN